jgi:ATP-dependent Lhr-like helicase
VNDLFRRLEIPMDKLGLRLGVRHGDRDDIRGRKKKPHVIITTPESLDVLLFRDDKSLKTVRALVIDEVHLLYNTQRGVQLSILIERLKRFIDPGKLQLAALSATIADLKEVGRFFFGKDENTKFLEFPAHRSIDAKIGSGGVVQVVKKLTSGQNRKLLAFVNRRKDCEELFESMSDQKHLEGAVFTHYSNLSKERREITEERFQKLKTAVCNATSTLELGIDIGDIDAVLLCSVPAKADSFLQRIGRGNRRSNKTVALCFVGMDENGPPQTTESLRYLALLDAARTGTLSERGTYEIFGAVAQQCMSIIASQKAFTSVKKLCGYFEKLPYVDRPTVENILSELVRGDYLVKHGAKNQYRAGGQLRKLVRWRRIYGNFPVAAHMLELRCGTEPLGEIPLFNTDKIEPGAFIKFAANKWKVLQITDETVEVEPAPPDAVCQSIEYAGKGLGFETFLNDGMWRIIHSEEFPEKLLSGDLRKEVVKARKAAQGQCGITDIPYCHAERGIRYYTFAGALVNEAVALITEKDDPKFDDHWLWVKSPIDWKSVPTEPAAYQRVFDEMFHPTADQSIFQKMLPTNLQVREYVQEWLKDKAVPKVLVRLAASEPVEVPFGEWPFP